MANSLEDYEVGELIAVQGKEGCQDPRCSRDSFDRCRGYHCPECGKPCSMMGHRVCPDKEESHGNQQ